MSYQVICLLRLCWTTWNSAKNTSTIFARHYNDENKKKKVQRTKLFLNDFPDLRHPQKCKTEKNEILFLIDLVSW